MTSSTPWTAVAALPPNPCDLPGFDRLCDAPGNIGKSAAKSALDELAQATWEGMTKLLKALTAWWLDLPSAAPTEDVSSPFFFVQSHTSGLVGALAIFGLIVAAGRMAWERRAEPARQAFTSLFTLVVVTGFGVVVVQSLAQVGDLYSDWIIKASLDLPAVNGVPVDKKVFDAEFDTLFAVSGQTVLTSVLVFVIGIMGIVSGLIQMVLMVVRWAMVALLTAFLPLGAAVSGTADGRIWWRRMVAWLIAWLLYKPVAATIYAFAFSGLNTVGAAATANDDANGMEVIIGVVTLILAVLALPALMRFVAPMVAPATADGVGSAAVDMAVAVGARMLPTGRNSGEGGPNVQSPRGAQQPGGRQPGDDGLGGAQRPSLPTGTQPGPQDGENSTPEPTGTPGPTGGALSPTSAPGNDGAPGSTPTPGDGGTPGPAPGGSGPGPAPGGGGAGTGAPSGGGTGAGGGGVGAGVGYLGQKGAEHAEKSAHRIKANNDRASGDTADGSR